MASETKDGGAAALQGAGAARTRRLLPCNVTPPDPPKDFLERPSLLQRVVGAVRDKRLTLLTAPPGFGKTTTLAQAYRILRSAEAPCLWISVTQPDQHADWLAQALCIELARLQGRAPDDSDDFAIQASTGARGFPYLVFIDNWNLLESRSTNAYFDQLLVETQGVANFAISSASIPDFGYSSFKLQGSFEGFSIRDLSFSTEEAIRFLQSKSNLEQSPTLFRAISQTEGWPAGLQLLRESAAVTGALADLHISGTRNDVAAYLNQTNFRRYSPAQRRYLCNLAVLDFVTPELAEFLFPVAECGLRFDSFTQGDYFLLNDGEGSPQHRFHSLYREFLLAQRATEDCRSEAEILVAASEWHRRRGELELAIPYAIKGGDWTTAHTLLEKYASEELSARGLTRAFCGWVEQLSAAGATISPFVNQWRLWALAFCGRWRDAADIPREETDGAIGALVDIVLAAFADDQPALSAAIDRFAPYRSTVDHFMNAVALTASSVSRLSAGDVNAALALLSKAEFAVEKSNSQFGRVWTSCVTALAQLWRGRAREARLASIRAERIVTRMGGGQDALRILVGRVSGIVAWHQGDREAAKSKLTRLEQESLSEKSLPIIDTIAHGFGALIEEPLRNGGLDCPHKSAEMILLCEALYWDNLLQQDGLIASYCESARAFLQRFDALSDDEEILLDRSWTLPQLIASLRLRLALADADHEAGLRLSTTVIANCQKHGRGLDEMKFGLLRSALLFHSGKKDAGLRTLISTLERLMESELQGLFLNERELLQPMLPGLRRAAQAAPIGGPAGRWNEIEDALSGNARSLAGPASNPAVASACPAQDQADCDLTDRERELLAFLDAGLSNRDISIRLCISTSTVKWHLQNLFAKLDAKNRGSAVRAARELGIIQ